MDFEPSIQRLRAVEMWEAMQEQVRPSIRHFGRHQTAKRIAWAAMEEHLLKRPDDIGPGTRFRLKSGLPQGFVSVLWGFSFFLFFGTLHSAY